MADLRRIEITPEERRNLIDFASGSRATLAIAFTDIEASTDHNRHLGDTTWGRLRDAHFAIARRLIEQNEGSFVKTVGDCVVAVFRAASAGVRFAIDFHAELRTVPEVRLPDGSHVRVRIGLHHGEIDITASDVFGSEVNLTARVESLAHAGQTFATSAIERAWERHRPAWAATVGFHDHGEFPIKGLTPERIFEVLDLRIQQQPRAPGTQPSASATARESSPSVPPRIAFLSAEPLIWRDKVGQAHSIARLNLEAERECLRSSLKEAGRALEVRFEAATAQNLSTLVTLGYRVLHYSGHGHPDCLAFEDERGAMHALTTDMLRQLCSAGGDSGIHLAFVSACHSRRTGEAFVAAGIPHVVAVRLEEPVFDSAATEFARQFYLALIVGRTVQQAFDIGKARVASMPDLPAPARESEKFLLLPEHGDHDVRLFDDAVAGACCETTPAEPAHKLPAIPDRFVGRNVEMQRVISDLHDGRLVTVRGAPGIGKSTLAAAVGRYLLPRRKFPDGLFFVPLRDRKSIDAVRAAISRTVGVEAKDDDELFAALQPLRSLLILDNCEDPLNAVAADFRRFLAGLLQSAPKMRLLLTSRQAVGGALPGVSEQVRSLRVLDDAAATLLFLAHASHALTKADAESSDFAQILEFLSGHPQAIALVAPQLLSKSVARLRADLEAQTIDANS